MMLHGSKYVTVSIHQELSMEKVISTLPVEEEEYGQ